VDNSDIVISYIYVSSITIHFFIILNVSDFIVIQVKEVCRSSLSELEHIIRPRNDTLFFPLENEIEIPPCAQSTIPENKTHFLNDIVEDSTVPIKVKELKNVQLNVIPQSTQSNISENKTEIINEIVEDSTIPIKGKEVKIINTENVQPNAIPQSVRNTIPENKTNIFNKIVKVSTLPIEDKTLLTQLDNVNTENVQANTLIESMDADNSMDSSSVDESLINKDSEDEDCTVMLNDFIDSD